MSWIKFWDNENTISDNIWKKNTLLFYNNSLNIINYESTDIILDIGSGKGFFCELIVEKVKEVHLSDTSSKCISLCENKFKNLKNVFYYPLSNDDYTNFDFINTKMTKIFVISVIQYYKSVSEVKTLIEQCKNLSVPNKGQLVLADIPIDNNIFYDIINTLYSSIKQHTFIDTCIFFIMFLFGEYGQIRKKNSIQIYKLDDLEFILNEMDLDYKIIKGITNLRNRVSIFINF
tara:strand:+ start:50 stop:745 length:696 start_codon:yes stop_codon:yes gene_type:complete